MILICERLRKSDSQELKTVIHAFPKKDILDFRFDLGQGLGDGFLDFLNVYDLVAEIGLNDR